MRKLIYIAGPISNNPNFKEDFANMNEKLSSQGYTVLDPSILPAGLTQEEYMRICIPMLQICNEVVMLKGWKNSVGAKIEHALAVQACKEISYERE